MKRVGDHKHKDLFLARSFRKIPRGAECVGVGYPALSGLDLVRSK